MYGASVGGSFSKDIDPMLGDTAPSPRFFNPHPIDLYATV